MARAIEKGPRNSFYGMLIKDRNEEIDRGRGVEARLRVCGGIDKDGESAEGYHCMRASRLLKPPRRLRAFGPCFANRRGSISPNPVPPL